MKIYARVKTAGRRSDILQPVKLDIPDSTDTLRDLITALAEAEVTRYNHTQAKQTLFSCLTGEQIEAQAASGKVSFGRIYSDKRADLDRAVCNAIRCYEDGLVRIFMGDQELTELDAPIHIPEDQEFTFIRLTFLAGRMW